MGASTVLQQDRNAKIGPALSEAVNAEAIFDTTSLAESGNANSYPMTLEIECVGGGGLYIRQGNSTVTLDATAANNARIPDGSFRNVVVQGPGDAYFAREAIGAACTIRALRIDRVST